MAFSRSIAAVAALSLVQLTQAWNVELPPCLDEFKPFVYSGCFQNGSPGQPPALIYRSGLDASNMTIQQCVAECKGNGFRYAGLEYYGVCYCGGTVNGPQLDESQCSFPCNGNKSETCGGDNSLSVWQDPTFPTGPVTIGDYQSAGCYTDDSSLGRTLSWSADVPSSGFTTENCLAACQKEGFPLAGTEYGGECWCGNVLANNTALVDASECNMPCNGNSTQTCGGRGRLNLYIAKDLESLEPCGYKPPVSSTSISTPTTTSVPTLPTVTYSPPTSTSEAPPVTTTAPSTTTKPPVTTTSSALCTATVTAPPSCEWKCGKWCNPPLPDWNNENDCLKAYATCAANIASCFRNAGFPDVLQCFNFHQWCGDIQQYCRSTCRSGKCNKNDCWNRNPGRGGSPPKTTTTVIPCPTTTTSTTTTKPTQCPPTPTSICTQPSNPKYGYGPGKPVGGIALPIVSCNDIYDDWRNNPFKLYIDQNSRKCPSYPPKGCPNACADACKEQYQQCRDVYVRGCQQSWYSRSKRDGIEIDIGSLDLNFDLGVELNVNAFISGWGSGDNSPTKATQKCAAQYSDCLAVNRNVDPKQQCKNWGC